MPLSAGTRVGPYEIVAAIGAGGMGSVYRARDPRIGRDVAIKAMSELSAGDPDRIARFQREAQILGALNHPHIAAIYGIEEVSGTQCLVLELVEGDTLASRLEAGPIPVTEALTIARQIADGLHAAHERGIIHRDLKPANVSVTDEGVVKVLDFGLAKARGASGSAASQTETALVGDTRDGVILGTAAYMSPEQARGRSIDKRTDVWAFGCLLYEMLTGRLAYPGETVSDAVAAVLGREPDWRALPATPARIQWLLRRCLEKDPKRRLHDMADARIELDEAVSGPQEPEPVGQRHTRERLAWAVAGLTGAALIAASVAGTWRRPAASPSEGRSYRSSIVLPAGIRFSTVTGFGGNPAGFFALSPDGTRLAVVAVGGAGPQMLWVRALDVMTMQPLAGTEGAAFPFWSADSRFIAFHADGKLKKIAAAGGPVVALGDAVGRTSGAWNRDDVILFTPQRGGPIHRVSASGGTSTPVTRLEGQLGDTQHGFPFFLPDGRHFVYFTVGIGKGGAFPGAVHVGSLDSAEQAKRLFDGGANAKYTDGHLLFLRAGKLVAQPFDADQLQLRGEPILISDEPIAGRRDLGPAGAFSVSDSGLLAYQPASTVSRTELVWFDGAGKRIGVLGEQADYAEVSLSPDGRRAAVSALDPERGSRDLWLYDTGRGVRTRFTFSPLDDIAPCWSPDGSRLVFASSRRGGYDLYLKSASGTGEEEPLPQDNLGSFQATWSAADNSLVYVAGGGVVGRSDVWKMPLAGERRPAALLDSEFVETHAQFSPDGRLIAYTSNESGLSEVYVARFPGLSDRSRVSTDGGGWPRWRADGKELFYLARDNVLMAAAVSEGPGGLEIGAARRLFTVPVRPFVRLDAFPYDVSRDGRFLINTLVEEPLASPITLVVNWTAGLARPK